MKSRTCLLVVAIAAMGCGGGSGNVPVPDGAGGTTTVPGVGGITGNGGTMVILGTGGTIIVSATGGNIGTGGRTGAGGVTTISTIDASIGTGGSTGIDASTGTGGNTGIDGGIDIGGAGGIVGGGGIVGTGGSTVVIGTGGTVGSGGTGGITTTGGTGGAANSTRFPIATTSGNELSMGAGAAFDGTNYLVAMISLAPVSGSLPYINGQFISQSGTKVGSIYQSGCIGSEALVAFDGTNYLLVGGDCDTQSDDIWGRFIAPSGQVVGNNFLIASDVTNDNKHALSGLACGSGACLVSYFRAELPEPGYSVAYGRIVSPSGTVGREFRISTGSADYAGNNVAFDGSNFVAVWGDDQNPYEVRGRFVSPGGIVGTEYSVNSNSYVNDNPSTVACDGTNCLVVWTDQLPEGWDVFGQLVDKSGNLNGGVINIIAAAGSQLFPSVAFDGTNYLVAWVDLANDANLDSICDGNEGTCWNLFGRYVSKSGSLVGSEFVIDNHAGNQAGGVACFGAGKYLVVIGDGSTFVPPGCTEGCSMMPNDVFGVFITP